MTKFSHLSKSNSVQVKLKLKRWSMIKFNLKKLNILIGVMIVSSGVTYLVQINALATKGYQIKALEQRVSELKEEKEDLELQSLGLQAMGSVKDKVADLGMVEITDTDYLTIAPVAVAR